MTKAYDFFVLENRLERPRVKSSFWARTWFRQGSLKVWLRAADGGWLRKNPLSL